MYRQKIFVLILLCIIQNVSLARDYKLSDFWFEQLPTGKIVATLKENSESLKVNVNINPSFDHHVTLEVTVVDRFSKEGEFHKTILIDPFKICQNEKWTFYSYGSSLILVGEKVKLNLTGFRNLTHSSICGEIEITSNNIQMSETFIQGSAGSYINSYDELSLTSLQAIGSIKVKAQKFNSSNTIISGSLVTDLTNQLYLENYFDTITLSGNNNFSGDSVQLSSSVKNLTISDYGYVIIGQNTVVADGLHFKGIVRIGNSAEIGEDVILDGWPSISGCTPYTCFGIWLKDNIRVLNGSSLTGYVIAENDTIISESTIDSTLIPTYLGRMSSLENIEIHGSLWSYNTNSACFVSSGTVLNGDYYCSNPPVLRFTK